MSTDLPTLRLNAGADRRLRGGHLWIYSNEVNVQTTPLKAFAPGVQARIESAQGRALGVAMISPNALICGRLVSRDTRGLDRDRILERLQRALALRERLFDRPFYRLVYGDSDGLPGLVVDRFGAQLVVQIASAGMELLLDEVVAALVALLNPSGILLKNDARIRAAENLPEYTRVAHGDVPEQVEIEENGVRFLVPLHSGQKTGWFYDHRNNRARLRHYVAGRRVLDVFSYIGGWGVQAAAFGAAQVTCVDSSEQALAAVAANAQLNGVADRVDTLHGAAFEVMKTLQDQGRRFDVVIMDPPAFIPRRKDIKAGEQAYHRANELALRLLDDEGILVSASCSMHLARERLLDILRVSALHTHRELQILDSGGQGFDHPIHPAIAETDYLKAVFCRVF